MVFSGRGKKFGGGVYKGERGEGGEEGRGGFLVVGERISKFLASAGLLLIPCPSTENLAIWSQFGPKLQNLRSDDSL